MGYKKSKNQNTSNDIIIDDGKKVYNIKNKIGERLGQFSFRPSDTNIVKRYEEVVEFFNGYKAPLDSNNDEVSKKLEEEIAEKISYLINADASEAFFSILGPFSILESGEVFFENVINAIGTVIEKEMSVRTSRMTRRMNKYVQKYHN